jgi:hypothetical protein
MPVPTNTDNEPPTAIEVPSMPAPNATGITACNTIITTEIKIYEILNNDNDVVYV